MIHDTNNFWEQLERLEKLIRAAEFKAGVIFSFHSLILGVFADRLAKYENLFLEDKLFLALSILWLIAVMVSVYYCFRCFMPDMELKYDTNVFFFRDAAHEFPSSKEYAKELIKTCTEEEKMLTMLSEQIHAESVIIEKKFYNIKRAFQFFILSFIFMLFTVGYWIFI